MYFLLFKLHGQSKRSAVQPQTICSEVPKAGSFRSIAEAARRGTGKGNEKSWENELIAWRTT